MQEKNKLKKYNANNDKDNNVRELFCQSSHHDKTHHYRTYHFDHQFFLQSG